VIKVSVVIPVYNPGHYLQACVESMTSQTLPADEYEVIFVDDGSTDDSPQYLDSIAADHSQLRVIHQENSGWPGQPRNVGIDAAEGEYVFFCDNDDWLGKQALERLYDFASACGSDVVLPKMAGIGRPVPYHVFVETVHACSLEDSAIMDSLTPHKLFRRAFLDEHRIRFPEGKRRLEDHLFVSTAYLLAKTISIYADYTCYFHIRREDSSNAGFRRIDWPEYFENLSEALEGVVARIEPGPVRERIFRRWLRVEMVQRLSGTRRLRMDDVEADHLLAAAQPVAQRYFSQGVVELLPPIVRPVGRAILEGDGEAIRRRATEIARWTVRPRLLQVDWTADRLQIAGTVGLTDGEDGRAPLRFAELLGGEGRGVDLWDPQFSWVHLDLAERRTGERWFVPATIHPAGVQASFTADLIPRTIAAGRRLPKGLWDLNAQLVVLGLHDRRRVTLTRERQPGTVLPEPVAGNARPRMAAYFTEQTSSLCLDVGLIKHRSLRQPPAPVHDPEHEAEPTPPEAKRATTIFARVARRARRSISG
jgi:glycosyltransferase involved in cell wall biosynthesis